MWGSLLYPSPQTRQVPAVVTRSFGRLGGCWVTLHSSLLVAQTGRSLCFLPSLCEVLHHVHGVPCEGFLGKQALLHTHTCLTKAFTKGGLLIASTEFHAYLSLAFYKALCPFCSPHPNPTLGSNLFIILHVFLESVHFPRVPFF